MLNEREKRNEIVLLGAELLGEDNLLFTSNILHLPLANLNSLLDGFQLLLKLRDFGRLLVSQLILELGEKLDVDCSKKKIQNQRKATYRVRHQRRWDFGGLLQISVNASYLPMKEP
jgi:hypothetical protein